MRGAFQRASQANVTALQFDCDSHPSRRWRVTDVTGNGVYQIRNVQTGKCLTIAGGVSTANNVTARGAIGDLLLVQDQRAGVGVVHRNRPEQFDRRIGRDAQSI